jgi:hypothetical protein
MATEASRAPAARPTPGGFGKVYRFSFLLQDPQGRGMPKVFTRKTAICPRVTGDAGQ